MSLKAFELQPSAAQTATSAGSAIRIPTLSMANVYVNITTGSGTLGTFDIYLQASPDGSVWYDVPADLCLQVAAAAASATVRTNARDIVDGKTTLTAERFLAIYKHLPAGYIRLAWFVSGGSSPSLTFDAQVDGK